MVTMRISLVILVVIVVVGFANANADANDSWEEEYNNAAERLPEASESNPNLGRQERTRRWKSKGKHVAFLKRVRKSATPFFSANLRNTV